MLLPSYDLHIHTRLSSCAQRDAIVSEYVAAAKNIGLTTMAFTDHLWDSDVPGASSWYAPQNIAHIRESLAEINAITDGPRILFGAESECNRDGIIGITPEHAAELDVLLVPHSHTHMRDYVMPAEFAESDTAHGQFMVDQFMRIMRSDVAPYITAIPHPFFACGSKTPQAVLRTISDAALTECCQAAAEAKIALEINTDTIARLTDEEIANSEFVRLYAIAKSVGCRITVGSDSHKVPGLTTRGKGEVLAKAAGLTTEDFLIL